MGKNKIELGRMAGGNRKSDGLAQNLRTFRKFR